MNEWCAVALLPNHNNVFIGLIAPSSLTALLCVPLYKVLRPHTFSFLCATRNRMSGFRWFLLMEFLSQNKPSSCSVRISLVPPNEVGDVFNGISRGQTVWIFIRNADSDCWRCIFVRRCDKTNYYEQTKAVSQTKHYRHHWWSCCCCLHYKSEGAPSQWRGEAMKR